MINIFKYCIKKFNDYYFHKLNYKEIEKATSILNDDEKLIFYNMSSYDKYHSFNVYEKLKIHNVPKIYLKLALLHDCGKHNISFLIRVLHKLRFKTILREHPYIGYEKLKDIDIELANLVRLHHSKAQNEYMKLFQDADDRS